MVGKVSVNSRLPLRQHVSLYRALLLSTQLGRGVGVGGARVGDGVGVSPFTGVGLMTMM